VPAMGAGPAVAAYCLLAAGGWRLAAGGTGPGVWRGSGRGAESKSAAQFYVVRPMHTAPAVPASRPPNRKKVHVSKILPPPWGLLGATWRLAPSHQLIGALDPPAVTSVSTPNTRFLIFVHGGVGPGVRPVLGQVSPKGAGANQGGLGPSRFMAGFRPAAPAGGGGARRSDTTERKKSPQKLVRIQSVEATVVPFRCYCGALANHRAQVGGVAGRNAPPRSFRMCRVGGFGPSAI
jgi:hypothetical protein